MKREQKRSLKREKEREKESQRETERKIKLKSLVISDLMNLFQTRESDIFRSNIVKPLVQQTCLGKPWYLYNMVAQKKLRMGEEKQVFFK